MSLVNKRKARAILRSRSRNGQSLILVLFVLIALAGVLALTLDYGFVLLARRQMQTGVNAASLEGLRGQGDPKYDDDDERLRRESARTLLQLNFDDDFDLSGNATTIGAGIDRSLVQGDGYQQTTLGDGSGFSNILDNRSNYIFRPDDFRLNLHNEQHGDMVVGYYMPMEEEHEEEADYSRDDFTLDETEEDIVPAFLIRMRRTHNPDGLDEVPYVSSRGGGLPLMMGLLGWMSADQPIGSHDIRRHGVVVRATAIAHTRPAMQVGVGDATLGLVGLLNVHMDIEKWEEGSPLSLGDTNGEAEVFDPSLLTVTSIGEEPPGTHHPSHKLVAAEGYVILTADDVLDLDGNENARIIGFGYVTNASIVGGQLEFTREIPQGVAVSNAMATLRQIPADWDGLDVSSLMNKVREHDQSNELLRAPALSRTVGR